jgi:hypothetical protein
MAYDGEAIRRVFTLVTENPDPTPPTLDVLASTLNECCFDKFIHVYADAFSNDEFKNDKTTVIKFFSNAITSVAMSLQAFENGAWVTKVALNNNNFGTLYPLNFIQGAIAYEINWKLVFTTYGAGAYRVRFNAEAIGYGGTMCNIQTNTVWRNTTL